MAVLETENDAAVESCLQANVLFVPNGECLHLCYQVGLGVSQIYLFQVHCIVRKP